MNEFKLELSNVKVPSVNHYLGERVVGKIVMKYLTKEAKEFKATFDEEIRKELVKNHNNSSPFYLDRLEVNLKLYFNNRRKHDVENYSKVVLDTMQGILFKDDSQVIKITEEKFYGDREGFDLVLRPYSGESTWGSW
jgi:Holliday junction resolvase RusA-like endonuclease